jgi:L-ascorbate metabolism protein UlaG (beta-lactamase superfamily)
MRSSDHFDGKRFFNLGGVEVQPFTAVPRMLREPKKKWPEWIDAQPHVPPALEDSAATVTFIGHSTFLIQAPGGNLLTDPMYSMRAGPFNIAGPKRVRPPAVRFEDLPPIATILLSHNHYDHCDLPTLRRIAKRFDPVVVTPIGNGKAVRSAGIRKVEEGDWWDTVMVNGSSITLTPAQHFSARTPWDRNRALWSGFAFTAGGKRMYFAGDSGYAPLFKDIGARIGPIDLALIPIGAYEPRWFMKPVHMNPEEAAQAHLDVGSAQSIGMHFGTFQLTTEGIDDPAIALASACEAKGIPPDRFKVLGFGESSRLK